MIISKNNNVVSLDFLDNSISFYKKTDKFKPVPASKPLTKFVALVSNMEKSFTCKALQLTKIVNCLFIKNSNTPNYQTLWNYRDVMFLLKNNSIESHQILNELGEFKYTFLNKKGFMVNSSQADWYVTDTPTTKPVPCQPLYDAIAEYTSNFFTPTQLQTLTKIENKTTSTKLAETLELLFNALISKKQYMLEYLNALCNQFCKLFTSKKNIEFVKNYTKEFERKILKHIVFKLDNCAFNEYTKQAIITSTNHCDSCPIMFIVPNFLNYDLPLNKMLTLTKRFYKTTHFIG